MTEGRLCQVQLLDGRNLELLVQPKLLSRELLDLVASHFNLKEKEYFGLCFIDDTGQNNWLQLDRKVLDHDFSKTGGPLELKFLVRFYIEKITYLKENKTVELFFLNAKSLVFNETIEVESANVFKLAAFALQSLYMFFSSAETARSDLKELPVLPTRVLREHPSLNYCEDKVIEHYKKLKGLTRGQAILPLMSGAVVCVHAFIQDKQGIPWWLGVSYKGIGQYDLQDKLKPRKLFHWKQLENLYFREKKFAVEVNDPHRRAVTKRTFGQSGLVIHTWYASHSLIKTIWVMAISQHQFYLDTKETKSKMTMTRSSVDIAMDLTETYPQRISKDQLIMASNGSLISAGKQRVKSASGSADSEVNEEQKKEKIAELKKKEKDLQDKLTQKLDELKKICMREAELTGRLPKEYPLATGEKAPQVRRRVGTAFKLDDLFPYDEDPYLRNLESKFALQQKIVEAAIKLASEGDLCKTVKKKRKNNFLDAKRMLEEIEKEINTYRIKKGKKPTQRASLILADDVNPSDLSSLSDSLTLDDGKCKHNITQCVCVYYLLPHLCIIRYQNIALQFVFSNYRSDDAPQHFRQRSGSLESQSQFLTETETPVATFTFIPARRSNSTEVLDDGSSYTSQSSVEYSIPGNHTHRHRIHGRHRKDLYANTGSMPNLAQPDGRCYQPRARPTTTAYYVTGYPTYTEPESYGSGAYMYDNEMEGHYNVQPSYYPTPTAYNSRMCSQYDNDEIDGMSQNLYATLRPPRNRPPHGNEQVSKNVHKALVVEHLRDWYHRSAAQKQTPYNYDYDYERGSHCSSSASSSTSLPSSSFPSSSYSPGFWVKQVASSPAQPQSSRGHRLSKVPFAKGSS
uniref:FERM domain containing 4B n=1 Tax=Mastacembelus armatus TaxID=205130 RepID=A0A7N8YA37_9TELE